MIEILKRAAYAGGKVTLKYFRQELEVNEKSSHQSIVTQADVESQQIIKDTIIRLMKEKGYKEEEIGFVGEENLVKKGKYTFVIDPLDGTTNFATGLENYCVLIALFIDKKLTAGVVYVPTSDTYYYAEKGKGAYKQKKNLVEMLTVQKRPLKESILDTYMSSSPKYRDEIVRRLVNLTPHVRGVRMMGGNHQLYFVENKFQIILVGRYFLWDIAANRILVDEAGGRTYDWSGKEVELDIDNVEKFYSIVTCHPQSKDEIFRILDL